jgi:phosphatidate phosphatase APP1
VSRRGPFGRSAHALRRALALLTRPVRAAAQRGDLVVQPYRGYGSREEIFLIGRVFHQPTWGQSVPEGTLRRHLVDLARRFVRGGVAGAEIAARFAGTEVVVPTDRDGYFRVHLRPTRPPPEDRLWHCIALDLVRPTCIAAEGEIFIPPPTCRLVVISDIDDTVMLTGVASKLRMLWRLFLQGASSRVAFPGMAAFLRALHHGRSGRECNPMLYVSRGPWSLYELLDEFFNIHAIPVGPLLFLREWGMTLQSPLPRRAQGHKLQLIRHMLAIYIDLPVILIGDSGQRDPEVYAQVVHEHPDRVIAIYIRDVSRSPGRRSAIEALAAEVAKAGCSLLLAADTAAMAEHAMAKGLAPAEALRDVLGEKAAAPHPRTEAGDDPLPRSERRG